MRRTSEMVTTASVSSVLTRNPSPSSACASISVGAGKKDSPSSRTAADEAGALDALVGVEAAGGDAARLLLHPSLALDALAPRGPDETVPLPEVRDQLQQR